MKKLTTLLLSGVLIFSAAACNDTASTNADAPETTATTGQTPAADAAKDSQQDATSDVRKDQLNSDIRAAEQRNNVTGGDAERTDGDLQGEVRSKLEANLPASFLTVAAEEGIVTISGTVPTQEQFAKIEPLAKEIKGVKSVTNKATVAAAKPKGQ